MYTHIQKILSPHTLDTPIVYVCVYIYIGAMCTCIYTYAYYI